MGEKISCVCNIPFFTGQLRCLMPALSQLWDWGESELDSQAEVHQLIQFRAAALVLVPAAGVALVHQLSQQPDGSIGLRVAHALKPQHPGRLAVHVVRTLPQLEVSHWGRETEQNMFIQNIDHLQFSMFFDEIDETQKHYKRIKRTGKCIKYLTSSLFFLVLIVLIINKVNINHNVILTHFTHQPMNLWTTNVLQCVNDLSFTDFVLVVFFFHFCSYCTYVFIYH